MRIRQQTEVRFLVGKEFLETLQERIGASKATDVVRAALGILDWATDEVSKGRVILSANAQGGEVRHLVMPELLYVKSLAAAKD